jgi:protein-tyrosine-phosphatase
MKATITFNLNDFDDSHRFAVHNKAEDMARLIWEFVYNSKKTISYEIEELDIKDPYEAIEKVYEHFRELLEDSDINPDKLAV